ncbi:MAG: hypothetical protein WKF58_09595 [Ilumatobacteraceae bacterium]
MLHVDRIGCAVPDALAATSGLTGDRDVKPLSNDERAEPRRRAIERKRRRDAARSGTIAARARLTAARPMPAPVERAA